MSMAAPDKAQAAGSAVGGGGMHVPRPGGICVVCGEAIGPGEKFMAALVETPAGFGRADCSMGCWEKFDRKDVVAFWQTVMPQAQEKKKLFVDDEVLCDLFARLNAVEEPAKLNFRFVLGLILMRKRLVIYDSTRHETGREVWQVRLKGREGVLDLVNPKLGEQEVREVSEQLNEILSQEL